MEEGGGREDRDGPRCVRPGPPEDLKRRYSVFSLTSILHFHPTPPLPPSGPLVLLSHHRSGPEQADLSALRQEILPPGPQMSCQTTGAGPQGGWDLG